MYFPDNVVALHVLLNGRRCDSHHVPDMLFLEGEICLRFTHAETEVEALYLFSVYSRKALFAFFQSMPSSAGDAHQMPRRQLSATIHLTQASSTTK